MSDSPSPEQRARAGRPAGPPDSHPAPVSPLSMPPQDRPALGGLRPASELADQACARSARRRRSASAKRSRCPANRAFRMRFSSRRNKMMSACSRWSQPPKAAISNWNGATVAVHAIAADRRVGHHGQCTGTWRTPRPRRQRPRSPRCRRFVFETRALPYAGSGGTGRLGVPKRISVIALMLRFP